MRGGRTEPGEGGGGRSSKRARRASLMNVARIIRPVPPSFLEEGSRSPRVTLCASAQAPRPVTTPARTPTPKIPGPADAIHGRPTRLTDSKSAAAFEKARHLVPRTRTTPTLPACFYGSRRRLEGVHSFSSKLRPSLLISIDARLGHVIAIAVMAGESKTITVRLPEELLGFVDKARGGTPREAWIREAIRYRLRRDEGAAAPEKRISHVPGPDVTRIRSSEQSRRGSRATPKEGKDK